MVRPRYSCVAMMVGFVLVLCVRLLPARTAFAEGSEAVEPAGVEKAAAADLAEAPAGDAQEAAAQTTGAEPEADRRIAVRDPVTGEVIDVEKVAREMLVALPPGDIKGTVMEPDGVTPHSNVTLVLVDARTGEEFLSATTDESGRFVLKEVPEGLYLMLLGNPGLAAVLTVTKEAELGLLNIVLAEPASSPFPDWAPEWMHEHPVRATVFGGAVIVAPIALFAGGGGGGGRITPITP